MLPKKCVYKRAICIDPKVKHRPYQFKKFKIYRFRSSVWAKESGIKGCVRIEDEDAIKDAAENKNTHWMFTRKKEFENYFVVIDGDESNLH